MNRLRVLRAERSLAQYQLAGLAAIDATRYWRIEHGLVNPRADERQRLAAVLGLSQRAIWRMAKEPHKPASVAPCDASA
jgi:transcriptional regulator with XRE-family HTH domain